MTRKERLCSDIINCIDIKHSDEDCEVYLLPRTYNGFAYAYPVFDMSYCRLCTIVFGTHSLLHLYPFLKNTINLL